MSKTTETPEATQVEAGTSVSETASPATGESGNTAPADGQPEAAALLPRPMVTVASLTAHPGNVRRDLDLSDDFVASIAANGVLVPLRITPGQDGAFRVIDGHRRLAAVISPR